MSKFTPTEIQRSECLNKYGESKEQHTETIPYAIMF